MSSHTTLRIAALAAAAALAIAGCGGGGSKSQTAPQRSPAVAASVPDLHSLESSLGHVIYWAGARAHYTYELTQTRGGNVYVRYLPAGVKVGDSRPNFLTIGTYPQPRAFEQVQAAARRKGARKTRLPHGGLVVRNASRPTSVYLAYPNSSLLVEVFDPSAAAARTLVRSGQIRPLR